MRYEQFSSDYAIRKGVYVSRVDAHSFLLTVELVGG